QLGQGRRAVRGRVLAAPPKLLSGRGFGMFLMTQTSRRRARRAFAVAAACAALPTAPAFAAPSQLSLIEDETLMLNSGPEVQAATLDEVSSLGADLIRVNVIWNRYAQ